jgi:DNA-binding CsgD family transcriptional regulator
MADPIRDQDAPSQVMSFYREDQHSKKKFFSDVENVRIKNDTDEGRFAELVERNKQKVIEHRQQLYPERSRKYHCYELHSSEDPKIVFGFFRHVLDDRDTSFTADEKKRFESWKEDLLILLRGALLDLVKSEPFNYFGSYFSICTKIARTYSLSASESRLLTEIAFGYTNEQIAERNFISVATVKKHLRNIFRKTDTKNRIDFIGRFFTSPSRVDF